MIVRPGFVADSRVTSARALGVPVVERAEHRVVRPPVVADGVPVDVPQARAVGIPDAVVEAPRARRDVDVAAPGLPLSRPGRVVFQESPYRRRVRLGIDR